jgi:hypothetical protein
MLTRLALSMLLGGCAVGPSTLAPAHPASATAPPGRLAPAPASLRPGVVAYPDVPVGAPAAPPDHHHHHAPD